MPNGRLIQLELIYLFPRQYGIFRHILETGEVIYLRYDILGNKLQGVTNTRCIPGYLLTFEKEVYNYIEKQRKTYSYFPLCGPNEKDIGTSTVSNSYDNTDVCDNICVIEKIIERYRKFLFNSNREKPMSKKFFDEEKIKEFKTNLINEFDNIKSKNINFIIRFLLNGNKKKIVEMALVITSESYKILNSDRDKIEFIVKKIKVNTLNTLSHPQIRKLAAEIMIGTDISCAFILNFFNINFEIDFLTK